MAKSPDQKASAVYVRLKGLLRTGAFRPGEHLPAEALAARLGVSVTPLREALTRLRGEGWVTLRPQEGFFTLVPTIQELQDRYGMAALILDHALAISPACPDASVIDTILLEEEQPKAERLVRAVETLFLHVTQATGNSAMINAMADFIERSHVVRLIDCEMQESRIRSVEAYRRVARALAEGDRSSAHAGVRDLLDIQALRMTDLVKEALARPHLDPGPLPRP